MAVNAQAYFSANPDVAASYASNNYGMTADEFANYHFANYGAAESRTPPSGVTNAQILDFLKANPGLSDAQIVSSMKAYGISPSQMASAVGLSEGEVASRVAATIPPGSSVTLGDTVIVPQYRTTGSGMDEQILGLESFATSKSNGDPNYKAPVGTPMQIYSADGEFVNTVKTKKDQSFLGGLVDAFKDPVVLAALGGAAAGGLLGGAGAAGAVGADLVGLSGIPAGAGALTAAETAALYGTGASTLGTAGVIGSDLVGLSGIPAGTGALTAAESAALYGTGGALTGGAGALTTGTGALTAGGAGSTLMGGAGGLTAGAGGLGLSTTGAGLGALGTGAGITAGTGLGTGVLTGSGLGTSLLGTGAGLAGLTGTGVLAGSGLGTSLLGTTGTGALTGTGVLTGSGLGTSLLGTGAGTAATVGGLGNTVANLGTGALTTGLEGLSTGLTGLGTGLTSGLSGLGTGLSGLGTGLASGLSGLGTGIGTGLSNAALGQLLSTGLTTGAGLLQQQTSKEAAQRAQAMIDAETAAAKQSAAFRPVGMTTRFGTSQFQIDPTTGQLVSAGYTLSPEAKNAQDRLVKLAESGLQQAEGAQAQFAPLQTGAESLFGLGNKYLAQSPEDVAKNYLAQQMALLQPGRELELANLQNKLQQQGRGGLSVAQGGSYGATTPELQALYNARAMQEAQLAAQAQQAGQQQVTFGAGLLGQGASAMGQYYGGQQAAYAPYTTALGQVQGLETAAQQPFSMSAALAQQAAQAGSNVGQLGLGGAKLSTALATSPAATTNPYSTVLGGLGASPAFGQVAGGLLGGGLSGLQSMFSNTDLGASGFGSGLSYGNQDLGLFL